MNGQSEVSWLDDIRRMRTRKHRKMLASTIGDEFTRKNSMIFSVRAKCSRLVIEVSEYDQQISNEDQSILLLYRLTLNLGHVLGILILFAAEQNERQTLGKLRSQVVLLVLG